MLGLENGLNRKKLCMFHIMVFKENNMFHLMVLKGRYLYVARTCISIHLVILKYKQFSNWVIQNVSNSGVGYFFFMCHLCMKLV